MAVTQKDIAREAGVSQTVVSDVLKGSARGRVSADTRDRILEAARRLSYRPNASAQALRLRQSRQVAYLTQRSDAREYHSLTEQIIGGVASVLAEADYRLLIQTTAGAAEQCRAPRELIASGICDACVVRAFEEQDALWAALKQVAAPCVVIGQCPDPDLTSVAHDAPGMVRAAIDHAVGLGHRRLGFVTPRSRTDYHRLLQQAWREGSREHGLDGGAWLAPLGSPEEARSLASGWLGGAGPSAVICTDAAAAVHLMHAALRAGRPIGADLELIVIGPPTLLAAYVPGTWYFRTDPDGIGRRAGEELVRQLGGGAPAGPIRVLPPIRQVEGPLL